ncbi:glycosyltransferase [candidate division KSB3 bacterium]|uniref:Glycosyltransferase n=1 Tax=candidate division KSB3 bacterium TaxID=2044937 RepID=A0A9D5JU09_9BACT|nr:glycosyltransferase [candidate division KSB3 bacterium]MBD3324219.1 glycosyltransferase [candidate division KSB3 bacterium]
MRSDPKVSIVIPVYNGSNYLREAIDSALAQTYRNIEVIVVNDGSNDEGKTEAIARSYSDAIRYFVKENEGVASALNLAIHNMTGEYFSWLSHDDMYYPQKIATQIEYLRQRGDEKLILYSDEDIIDQYGNSIGKHIISPADPDNFIFSLLIHRNIGGCSLLIPKQAFTDAGLFDTNLRTTQDYDMWFRLLRYQYQFEHIPEILVKSRTHPTQGIRTLQPLLKQEKNSLFIRVLERFSAQELCGNDSDHACCYLKLALHFKKEELQKASAYARVLGYRYMTNQTMFSYVRNLALFMYVLGWHKYFSMTFWRIHLGSLVKRYVILKKK